MQHCNFKLAAITAGLLCFFAGASAGAQSSTGIALQTVNQAQTVTSVHPVATSGGAILPGQSVTLFGVVSSGLSTPGILNPTQTVQFNLNGAALGAPITVTNASATNLLPFSQAFAQWTKFGGVATVTDQAIAGPFDNGNATGGVSNTTASTIVFPVASTSNPAGVRFNVPESGGPALTGQPVTFSVWVEGAAAGNLTLVISDGNGANAQPAITIPVQTTYHRFEKTITIPAGFANGFTVAVESTSTTAQTVNIQGAQFEQAAFAGPYVLTTGTSLTGIGAFAKTVLANGFAVDATHSTNATNAAYSGDTNYLGSTSPTASFNVAQASANLALASSLNPSLFGQGVTFSATLTGDGTPFAAPGVIIIAFNGTALGTCPVTAGATAPQSCSATVSNLPTGTDAITATYTGDPNYTPPTPATVAQVVNTTSVTITTNSVPNPSTYGQNVAFTITLVGATNIAVPTGSVTVVDNGTCTTGCTGGTTLGGGPLTLTNGVANFSSAVLAGGQHNLVITYSGDSNFH
jgi:Bacterial Ig-like domain (group 3)